MSRSGSDTEGGALGHGPTGVLFAQVSTTNDDPLNPQMRINWFQIYGMGPTMRQLIRGQKRKVKSFDTDKKILAQQGFTITKIVSGAS